MNKFDSTLYFITDSTGLDRQVFLNKVESALQGGVTLIQLREKNADTREYFSLATELHELTQKYGVPLIIDDRVDIALASDAEGVHLGQSDMPIDVARRLLGDEKIIGATAKTVKQALEAYSKGADYLGTGAIFPTTTKVKTVITSPQTLDEICHAVPIPVNAIGGLTKENLGVLSGIPIAGICAVSAIMRAQSPKQAAQALRLAFSELCPERSYK